MSPVKWNLAEGEGGRVEIENFSTTFLFFLSFFFFSLSSNLCEFIRPPPGFAEGGRVYLKYPEEKKSISLAEGTRTAGSCMAVCFLIYILMSRGGPLDNAQFVTPGSPANLNFDHVDLIHLEIGRDISGPRSNSDCSAACGTVVCSAVAARIRVFLGDYVAI